MDAEVVSSLNDTRSGSLEEVGFVCQGGREGHGEVVVSLGVICEGWSVIRVEIGWI